ncbi:hypothetical protein [Deinococcus altitudinis]|uniref:hypothetical protein n=1 Tax=Deinococcus altitudinis TaxID=468914 RepID=UPI0038928553
MNRPAHLTPALSPAPDLRRLKAGSNSRSVIPTRLPRTPLSRTSLTLASLALLCGSALAQTTVPNLSAYRSMAAALDQSVNDRASSSAKSLSDLDRASAAYVTLRPSISSTLLTSGIDRALQSSRAALGRAPADLEAQVEQARSLMRKALNDQTLARLGTVGSAPVPEQSALLAAEFGLQGAARSSFLAAATARDTGKAARLLRNAAAQKIQANLSAASADQTNTAQRTRSYLALARATGWFTVVQDAPETGGLTLPQFTQALSNLTGGNSAALATSLSGLQRGAAAFVKSSAQAVQTGGAATPSPAGTTTPTIPATSTGAAPTGQTSATAAQTPATQTPANQSPATQTSTSPTSAAQSSDGQRKAGLDAVYAALARAQSAAGHADLPQARTQAGRAAQALSGAGLSSTAGYDALEADVNALQDRTGLRASDVQAVLAELNNVEQLAAAQPTSALDATSASVSRLPPPIWPLLFLIVGLLALYPLYLLNLAFGGRNGYWRAIAASLLLLFLPVLLEGLGGTLAYLGDLSGVGALRALGNLSLRQGAWGLPIWLLLTAAAVGLASYGFRGLCRQFGLLGGSGGSAGANPTRAETAQTALDWDEEL